MWERKELKELAKSGVKRNYWKTVFAAFLFSVLNGGFGFLGGFFNGFLKDSEIDSSLFISFLNDTDKTFICFFAVLIVVAILFISIAFINPFSIGAYKYSINAVRGNGYISDLGYGFDLNYKRNVKVMFLYDLYIFLWTLLFVIPGVVKTYEYRMIPYLLAENPAMDKREAFSVSKAMMKGNKWNAFVLDLSFILWDVLSGITFGIAEIFWVNPYKHLTNAALYDKLKVDL